MKQFAIQLDKSISMNTLAILSTYVKFLDKDHLREEIIFAGNRETESKRETILKDVLIF